VASIRAASFDPAARACEGVALGDAVTSGVPAATADAVAGALGELARVGSARGCGLTL
jgi:hypothetical protein